MENAFITITGINGYYGKNPFKIDRVLRIVKEPDNRHDAEAIRVELPFIDTVGYVANSVGTVYAGTESAGKLYDKIGEYAYAQVMFVTHSSVIALVLSPEEVEVDKTEKTEEAVIPKREIKKPQGTVNKIGFI
ncbi:MAG: HIRAN domain-containing protein [Clostridia bacterium]|nr:HIRAN domain-containing protein [Clostridia bacterium]